MLWGAYVVACERNLAMLGGMSVAESWVYDGGRSTLTTMY